MKVTLRAAVELLQHKKTEFHTSRLLLFVYVIDIPFHFVLFLQMVVKTFCSFQF